MSRSILLQYSKSVTTAASISNTIYLTPPIRFNRTKSHQLKVLGASIPKMIPNVYVDAANSINNTRLDISNGTDTIEIELTTGLYSVEQINSAINDLISGWMTSAVDSAFNLRANLALGLCYIVLDSTKLGTGSQISVNFKPTGSTFNTLLGYSATTSFATDGTYTGDVYPKIDYQGNNCKVYLDGFGPLCLENSTNTNFVFSINLDTASGANSYSYPGASGIVPYPVDINVPDFLSEYRVRFLGRDNREIIALDGIATVEFRIYTD